MQHLDTLWKVLNSASTVRDLAQETRVYEFAVAAPTTFYLHTEQAQVQITRWSQPRIRIRATLQAGFGWRMRTDQDEAGVYLVARRRMVIGGIARARFDIHVPDVTHLALKLTDSRLTLDGLSHTLHIPAPTRGEQTITTTKL